MPRRSAKKKFSDEFEQRTKHFVACTEQFVKELRLYGSSSGGEYELQILEYLDELMSAYEKGDRQAVEKCSQQIDLSVTLACYSLATESSLSDTSDNDQEPEDYEESELDQPGKGLERW